MPNPLRNMPYFWVPAGLLEKGGSLEIVAHLCTAFKAPWGSIPLQCMCFDELPNLSEFVALVNATDT